MTFWKKQNYGDHKNINGGQQFGGREEEMNKRGTGNFQGRATILYDTIIVNTHHCTFVKIHRMYKKNEP